MSQSFLKNRNFRVGQIFIGRLLFLSCLWLTTSLAAIAQPTSKNITYDQAYASLKTNRDRLLASYATARGYENACQVWSIMSSSQKGVFLTITDYLGRRSLMHFNQNYEINYLGDEDDRAFGCASLNEETDCKSGCYVHPINYYGPSCFMVSGQDCARMGKCEVVNLPRTDYDMILNHVSELYAVNGSNGSNCGGSEYNRVFFSADEELIYLIRNIDLGLPTWDRSTDLAGPHSPFTQSREGLEGKPRGQIHNWAWDYEVRTLTRYGVVGVYDPHIVEMDIDFNLWHDSNPECFYNNTYGRYFYENYWYTRGLYGPAELNYSPCN